MNLPRKFLAVLFLFFVLALACSPPPDSTETIVTGTFIRWAGDSDVVHVFYRDENNNHARVYLEGYADESIRLDIDPMHGDSFAIDRVVKGGVTRYVVRAPIETPDNPEPAKPLFVLPPSATEPTEPNPEPIVGE